MTRAILAVALLMASVLPAKADLCQRDPVSRAMWLESRRTVKLKSAESPSVSFVAYGATDVDALSLVGSFGGLLTAETRRYRKFRVDLFLGKERFDAATIVHLSTARKRFSLLPRQAPLPILRRLIWARTDRAYRLAVGKYRQPPSGISARRAQINPQQMAVERTQRTSSVDQKRWENIVRKLSSRFSRFPSVIQGTVSLNVKRAQYRFVSTDGACLSVPRSYVSLIIVGEAVTPSGDTVKHYASLVRPNLGSLPSFQTLLTQTDALLKELALLSKSRRATDYIGPVLFERRAAAQLLERLVVPALSGDPKPRFEPPTVQRVLRRTFGQRTSALLSDQKVFPATVNLVDDGPRARLGTAHRVGALSVDDEGVRTTAVRLTNRGVLNKWVRSRSAEAASKSSTGHARSDVLGNRAHASNVRLTARVTRSARHLRRELLRRAAKAGNDYGIVITLLDDPNVGLGARSGRRAAVNSSARVLVAHRVYKDGRQEVVRGFNMYKLSPKILRSLVGVGTRYTVHNYLARIPSRTAWLNRFVPSTIASPSLLIDNVSLIAPLAPPRISRPLIAPPGR